MSKNNHTLNHFKEVSVINNKILNEIIKCQNIWDINPIIFVNGIFYQIELCSYNGNHITLYQNNIYVYPGTLNYEIINKRKVKIFFEYINNEIRV
jgi:hypothetical protein